MSSQNQSVPVVFSETTETTTYAPSGRKTTTTETKERVIDVNKELGLTEVPSSENMQTPPFEQIHEKPPVITDNSGETIKRPQ